MVQDCEFSGAVNTKGIGRSKIKPHEGIRAVAGVQKYCVFLFVFRFGIALTQVSVVDFPLVLRQEQAHENDTIQTYLLDSCLIGKSYFHFLVNLETPYLNVYKTHDTISISCDFEKLKWIRFMDKKLLVYNPYSGLNKLGLLETNTLDSIIDGYLEFIPILICLENGEIIFSKSFDGGNSSNDCLFFKQYLGLLERFRL